MAQFLILFIIMAIILCLTVGLMEETEKDGKFQFYIFKKINSLKN